MTTTTTELDRAIEQIAALQLVNERLMREAAELRACNARLVSVITPIAEAVHPFARAPYGALVPVKVDVLRNAARAIGLVSVKSLDNKPE